VPWSLGGTDMALSLGMVGGESEFYGTPDPYVTAIGLSGSSTVQITDSFSLPVSASYVLNPSSERAHLVFGFTLSN